MIAAIINNSSPDVYPSLVLVCNEDAFTASMFNANIKKCIFELCKGENKKQEKRYKKQVTSNQQQETSNKEPATSNQQLKFKTFENMEKKILTTFTSSIKKMMTTTLTAFIVDDEQDARQALEILLQKEFPQIEISAQTDNAQNALELIMDKSPDLLFLDIQMPDNDGFWLANKISKLKIKPRIIFVTAYDEYAIEAIKYAAFDFLTKPVIPDVLRETITRFKESYGENNHNEKFDRLNEFLNRNKIKFNTFDGFVLLDYRDIIFCEADANYSDIHLINGKKEIVTLQLGVVEKKRFYVKYCG